MSRTPLPCQPLSNCPLWSTHHHSFQARLIRLRKSICQRARPAASTQHSSLSTYSSIALATLLTTCPTALHIAAVYLHSSLLNLRAMTALSLVIPAGYGLVLLEALAIGAHCVSEGFAGYGTRKRVFNKAFFDKHFPDVKPTPEDGYPGTTHTH